MYYKVNPYLYHVALLLFLVGLVIYKLPHLSLGYFWDAAWVYAPAIQLMYENGLSLLPDAIPVEYSRGHPLMFHFLGATWITIFGYSKIALHSFALTISICFLLAAYALGKLIADASVGFFAVVIFSLQQIFLAQSALVLPEVLLSLLMVLSLYFFLKEKYVWFVVFATMLLLTKESGLIFLGAIIIWIFLEYFFQHEINSVKHSSKLLIVILIPLCLAASFFFIQKIMFGWFFYPEHVNMVEFDADLVKSKLTVIYNFVFEDRARKILSVGLMIWIVLFGSFNKWYERILLLLCMGGSVKILFNLWPLPDFVNVVTISVLLAVIFKYLVTGVYSKNKLAARMIGILFIFCISYMIFSAANFFTPRYLISLVFFFILTSVFFIWHLKPWKPLYYIVIAYLIIHFSLRWNKYYGLGDTDIHYVSCGEVMHKVVSFCESNNLYDTSIYTTFLNKVNLEKPEAGYLYGKTFSNVTHDVTSEIRDDHEYVIFTNLESLDPYKGMNNQSEFYLVKRLENGECWGEIYRRN